MHAIDACRSTHAHTHTQLQQQENENNVYIIKQNGVEETKYIFFRTNYRNSVQLVPGKKTSM